MRRPLPLLFVALALPSLAAVRAAEPAVYPSSRGPYEVAELAEYLLHDAARDKDLPLRIQFPKAEGRYPLIIYSHGAFGSKENYGPLTTAWAAAGYVVVQPTHEDSLKLLGFAGGLDLKRAFAKWPTRPPDVALILDRLDELEAKVPGLGGKIDRERIGLGGHSFGAHTSQLVGGARMQNPLTGRFTSFADERPDCFLLISPQGVGGGLAEESWAEFARPAMVVTGTHDDSPHNGKDYKWRLGVWERLPAPDKHLLFVEEAHHNFGGISGKIRLTSSGEANPRQVAIVRDVGLAFWDAYLYDDAKAKEFLASDLATATDGVARLDRKTAAAQATTSAP